jgi:hypothetical protein
MRLADIDENVAISQMVRLIWTSGDETLPGPLAISFALSGGNCEERSTRLRRRTTLVPRIGCSYTMDGSVTGENGERLGNIHNEI